MYLSYVLFVSRVFFHAEFFQYIFFFKEDGPNLGPNCLQYGYQQTIKVAASKECINVRTVEPG